MALFENFPYTNLHELNLDWLIQEMKELEQKVQDGPVVSVNGLTGEVVLYRESNIQFPDITDSTVTKWEIFRYLNNHIFGIQFDNNGNVYALRDFARTKLLTWDDIPPEAGVISINGLYGVVHLSGTDIPYMGGETDTVYDKLSDLDDDITSAQADINELSVTLTTVDNAIKRGIAYLESTDTAVNNIPSGSYVFWKNGAYISTSAISVGDSLSSTNLTAVATGGFINALKTEIETKLDSLTFYTDITTLGLISGARLASIYSAMAQPSIALLLASDVAEEDRVGTATTYSSGYIKIEKRTNARSRIYYIHKTNTDYDYEMAVDTNNVPTGIWIMNSVSAVNSKFSTVEDKKITRISTYFTERDDFKARRVGNTIVIFSYVNITTQVPAGTNFADIGFPYAEGMYTFMHADGTNARMIRCSAGILKPMDSALETGYYYVSGCAVTPI